ncbi:helix-turn-helix domain-containing protein [Sphingobacterium sp. SG20118]|uniref:helix-turn-helix domain-containing protein n=1 Tax=Sphingobacterium sp. SG20118 TaxID=3367156 RepID=UPI0037DFBE4C
MNDKEPKIFFARNLKFLRERKKVSQTMLGDAINVTRTKLALIEIGKTKAMDPTFLLSVSTYFKISLDTLLTVDISKLGELKIRDLQAGNDIYIKGGNLRVLAISVDKTNNENVDYVPIMGKAGYISGGYCDPIYIADLPKYHIPNLPKNNTYRTFPIMGDSMLPFPQKMDITGKFMADWRNHQTRDTGYRGHERSRHCFQIHPYTGQWATSMPIIEPLLRYLYSTF